MSDQHIIAPNLEFMRRAIVLSQESMQAGCGGPFAAVITRNNEIVAEGFNQVTSTNDPTAHAEVMAIRQACQALDRFELSDCQIYTSCEPCPMCLSAIYWARLPCIYYANSRYDAAAIGFDDEFLYREVASEMSQRTITAERLLADEALAVFKQWQDKPDKISY